MWSKRVRHTPSPPDTDLERSSSASFSFLLSPVAPLFVWKTSKFPAALKGMEFSMGMSALLVVWTSLTIFCVRREVKKAVERGQDEKDRAFRQRTQDVSVV
jgi:hypothetical protein